MVSRYGLLYRVDSAHALFSLTVFVVGWFACQDLGSSNRGFGKPRHPAFSCKHNKNVMIMSRPNLEKRVSLTCAGSPQIKRPTIKVYFMRKKC